MQCALLSCHITEAFGDIMSLGEQLRPQSYAYSLWPQDVTLQLIGEYF